MISHEWMQTAFKDHEIKTICNHESIQRFRFSKPDTNCYGFYLTFADSLIVMTGDIGTLIVEPGYGRPGLPFLRGTLDSEGYFLSKVPYETRQTMSEFSEEIMLENAREYLDNEYITQEQFEEFERIGGDGDIVNEVNYYKLCHEFDIDEPCSPRKRKDQVTLQLLGLRKFIEKLDVNSKLVEAVND